MKFLICSNNINSFSKILAQGLKRKLNEHDIQSEINYSGLDILSYNIKTSKGVILIWVLYSLSRFFVSILKYDVIVIVSNIPTAFLKNEFVNIEKLRKIFPKKIFVCYMNYYLPTRGPWEAWLKEGNKDKGVPIKNNYGLERYDWYLASSLVSEFPLKKEFHPVSHIGLNLSSSDDLYSEKKDEFIALVDFERSDHMQERLIQLRALEELGIEYIVLNGSYTIDKIRSIYRKVSIYFVAHRESFGLPICEIQACGAYVFTPYSNWCPSHWKKERLDKDGEGVLGGNFIIYENDIELLKQKIIELKKRYNSIEVRNRFIDEYPEYYFANNIEISNFLDKIKNNEINSGSHSRYIK